jgi:hypothetical protein
MNKCHICKKKIYQKKHFIRVGKRYYHENCFVLSAVINYAVQQLEEQYKESENRGKLNNEKK